MRNLTIRTLAVVGLLAVAAAPAPKPVLTGNGFTVKPAATTKFGVSRAVATAAASKALGAPIKSGRYEDCGQGTGLDYARFKGGFELTFERGKLVGWTVEMQGDRTLRTTTGIGIGSTVAQLQKAYPNVFIDPGNEEEGGLGPTFALDEGPSGFLDGDRVTSKVTKLFAGATCIVG